jgi:uncharacterized protein
MEYSLSYWCDLYKKYKENSLCLDIETIGFNRAICMVGLYKPQDGLIDCDVFIRGKNLNKEILKESFQGCKMIITYNGISFDIPRIKKEFPGVIPEDVQMLDLYLLAKQLNYNTNLKLLESCMGIDRLHEESKQRGIAIKLWRKYANGGNQEALKKLIEYNKQDTINLYPLAEKLIKMAQKKINQN